MAELRVQSFSMYVHDTGLPRDMYRPGNSLIHCRTSPRSVAYNMGGLYRCIQETNPITKLFYLVNVPSSERESSVVLCRAVDRRPDWPNNVLGADRLIV